MKVITRVETVSKDRIAKAVYHNLRLKEVPHADRNGEISLIFSAKYRLRIEGKLYEPIIESPEDWVDYLHALWNYVQYIRLKEGLKPFRRNTNPIVEFIIVFSKDSRDFVNDSKNWEVLDGRAKKFIKRLEEEYGIKVILGVRHSDETTTHYHILAINYSFKWKKTFTKLFRSRKEFSRLQDLVAESFKDLGFQRGEKYDPSKHTYKQIHKSIWELHKELPKEIEAKREELKRIEEDIEKRKGELKKLRELLTVKGKLEKEIAHLEEMYRGILTRQREALSEIEKLERRISELRPAYSELENTLKKRQKELEEFLRKQTEEEKRLRKLKEESKRYEVAINNLRRTYEELERIWESLRGVEEEKENIQLLIRREIEESFKKFEVTEGFLRKESVIKLFPKDLKEIAEQIAKEVGEKLESYIKLAKVGLTTEERVKRLLGEEIKRIKAQIREEEKERYEKQLSHLKKLVWGELNKIKPCIFCEEEEYSIGDLTKAVKLLKDEKEKAQKKAEELSKRLKEREVLEAILRRVIEQLSEMGFIVDERGNIIPKQDELGKELIR